VGAALALSWLVGCSGYSEFRMPPPEGRPSRIVWQWKPAPLPVIGRGEPGAWDSVDALNPSVIRDRDGYVNLYSGFDGKTWRTGLAVSPDGTRWARRGVVIAPDASGWEGNYIAANGALLRWRGELHYWYQAGEPPRIGMAHSADGKSWRKWAAPVLAGGPRGSWDERATADPYVIESGGALYLFYLGEDRARRQRLGVARSEDGVRWEKLRANPILELGQPGEFDENGLGEPAVGTSHAYWWMLYTGRDRAEWRRLGLARSADGSRWERVRGFQPVSGSEGWNRVVMCDPSVWREGEELRVWFGGGSRAHPAENVEGQIGEARLVAVPEQAVTP
jgi:predicted GH43/DUF377 family glycosyl hydrolase